MKVKCFSVRLESLTQISPKCYKARAFDGSEALIPVSQVYGEDFSVQKSEAYWISEWILGQKQLQYSSKKAAWFDKNTGKMLPSTTTEKHTPAKLEPVTKPADPTLER